MPSPSPPRSEPHHARTGALAALGLVVIAGCAVPQPTTITVGPKRELLVEVLVNHKRVVLQLDTGSSTTLLTPSARRFLQLRNSLPAVGGGAGGELSHVEYVTVRSIRLASEAVYAISAAVLDLDDAGGVIDGVLGMDVLGRYVLEVDLREYRFALHPRGATGFQSPDLVAVDYTPLVGAQIGLAITIDGRPATAVLDLGASRTFANTHTALTLDDAETTISAVIGADRNRLTFRSASDVKLGFGGLALHAPSVWINDLPIFRTFGLADQPAVILGTDVLAGRRIVIDPFARRVYLSR